MPYLVDDINEAVAYRWGDLDPMLPAPGALPDGCQLVVSGANGRPAGVGACRHWQVPDDVLEQVWGAVTRLELTPRLREPEALDELLGQWRVHLAALPEASEEDSAAMINWPSRDIGGVRALLKHGMQPIAVLAVRPAGRTLADAVRPASRTLADGVLPPGVLPSGVLPSGVLIRAARLDDLDAVVELELGVIRFDAHFGAAILRPATEALVRVDTLKALTEHPDWSWVAERDGRLVGLVHVQPPEKSAWVAVMTRPGTTAYLQTMFVAPDVRAGGLGAALVKHAHAQVEARGVSTILLHYAQLNPLSGPFWSRMGYRPLWTGWETRPALALR